MWETSWQWLGAKNTEDFMYFALNFSEKLSDQKNIFSYTLKLLLFQAQQSSGPTRLWDSLR